jgi:cell wall-associated NlpC family hydrolase
MSVAEDNAAKYPKATHRRGAVGLGLAAALGFAFGGNAAKKSDRRKKQSSKKEKDKKGKRKKQQAAGNGRDVVRVARKYKGAKYKWGGASPKGFDCSGFTWYVYQKATGMDIGRGVDAQWDRGRSIGKNDWKPGDIVFFKNTFERGLSHNGIFIGGDEFIHAENEKTGVVISSLSSDYYSDHYAGARRLL